MASAEAAVAATEPGAGQRGPAGSVVLAALALPGVWAPPAQAEGAPEKGLIGLKVLRYQDAQDDLKRISVTAPSAYLLVPVSPSWSLEGSGVVDSVSGATPRQHTSLTGASEMSDRRRAGDLKVTYHTRRASFGVSLSYSTENDYDSLAVAGNVSVSSDDNNTTFSFGIGRSNDTIIGTEKKFTNEILLAWTQALSPRDLVQLNLTVARGVGFFNDPYKLSIANGAAVFDTRPGARTQTAALLRWNHHVEAVNATLRPSYRFYTDTFGVQAHTYQLEWAQAVGAYLTLTPLLRYYTQSAADFYADPDPANPDLAVAPTQAFYSTDQRLAAYGSLALGLRADLRLGAWTLDLKAEGFQQNTELRLGGNGSIGLDPLRAYSVQVGVARSF